MLLNPELIVIGGDLASVGEALFEPMRRTIARSIMSPHARALQIVASTLGDSAGARGAAALVLDNAHERLSMDPPYGVDNDIRGGNDSLLRSCRHTSGACPARLAPQEVVRCAVKTAQKYPAVDGSHRCRPGYGATDAHGSLTFSAPTATVGRLRADRSDVCVVVIPFLQIWTHFIAMSSVYVGCFAMPAGPGAILIPNGTPCGRAPEEDPCAPEVSSAVRWWPRPRRWR
jgi:hypothetical protein